MPDITTSEIRLTRESQPLTEGELNILKFLRLKKGFYLVTTYLALIGLIIYAYFKSKNMWSDFDEEEQTRFILLSPYLFAFLFLLLTGFFINYYYRLVHPFVKDIKEGTKELIWFNPEKYQTPFFAEYYIVTPLKNKQRIKIRKELFDAINHSSSACINFAKYSKFVFTIQVDGKEAKFNETNEPVDL